VYAAGMEALYFPAGTGANLTCQFAGPSTTAISAEEGPIDLWFLGSDGTNANATLNTGAALSVDLNTSTILSLNTTIVVNLSLGARNRTVTLNPGQSVFVHTTTLPTCVPICHPIPIPHF